MTLSPLARRLAAHVADATRQKIEIESLYAAAVAFDRSLATVPAARQEIRRALDEIVTAGLVLFPRSPREFDTRDEPPLPLWVRRPPRASRPSVPARERSLNLFGDEKRLDRLASTRLFTSGALTLDLLRCHTVPIPFVSQWVPGTMDPRGTALLIAENHHTYTSLLNVTRRRAAAGGPGRHVGYGTGGQFASAVLCVPLLDPLPDRIVYFGDVDVKGLQIPSAADSAARQAGLPAVVPANSLYELLFELGCERPATAVQPAAAEVLAAWLGPVLAVRGQHALVRGVRLPQEAVGYEQLTDGQDDRLDQL
jgi:hypothetical protein